MVERMKKGILALFVLLSLFACARLPVTKPEDALEQVSWWRGVKPRDDLEFKDIASAVRQSLEYYKKLPPETRFSLGPDRVAVLDMVVTLQNFLLIIENSSLTYDQKVKQIKRTSSSTVPSDRTTAAGCCSPDTTSRCLRAD